MLIIYYYIIALVIVIYEVICVTKLFKPLRTNPTKWSNTLEQFADRFR